MDCRRYSKKLADLALQPDAPLDAGLAQHLSSCAACRQKLDAQRRLAQAIDLGLAAAVSTEPSPSFAAGVRARIADESAPRHPWFSGWVPVAAGALAVFVLMVAWFTNRQRPEPVPTPAQNVASTAEPNQRSQTAMGPSQSVPPAVRLPHVRVLKRFGPSGSQNAQTREPEVIVPPGQREAVLRFYAAVWSGRVEVPAVQEKSGPLEVAELRITPLEIPELPADWQRPE